MSATCLHRIVVIICNYSSAHPKSRSGVSSDDLGRLAVRVKDSNEVSCVYKHSGISGNLVSLKKKKKSSNNRGNILNLEIILIVLKCPIVCLDSAVVSVMDSYLCD